MERVLVTGGAGFIGSYVVEQLLARGCKVLVLDCLVPQVHPKSPTWPDYQPDQEGLTKWFGDVRDFNRSVLPALREFQPDTVIHLAAAVGVGQSAYHPAHYTSTNVTGTVAMIDWVLKWNGEVDEMDTAYEEASRVDDVEPQEGETMEDAVARVREAMRPVLEALDAKRGRKVQRVFVAGSMSSYGEGAYDEGRLPDPLPTPETRELHPTSIYAWTKAEAERAALWLGRIHGLDVRVGRFFNTYGSRQALGNPYTGVGAIFAARAHAGLAPVVYEDGLQSRDFIHASDVAAGVLAILDHGQPGEVYNVGTGRRTSVLELAELICRMIGKDVESPIVTFRTREGDIRHCYADAAKLRALGWEPKVPLEEGVVELLAWVASQPAESKELLDKAHAELEALGLLK